jgi:hypothetical protein
VLAVEGERAGREKSPSVSFSHCEERQYQTVHAGCEIPVKPGPRERTRSGRFSREWRGRGGARPSVIDWPLGKFPWSRDRKSSAEKGKVKPEPEPETKEESARLSPKARPRSKSDRFSRPTRKQVVEVYRQAAFDWPLGPLGRIRQKYGKSRVPKAKSEDQLAGPGTEGGRLKRRSSERQKRSKGVQFEDQQATPWWNYPIKLMRGAAGGGGGQAAGGKRRRRRHESDPESRKA